MDRTFDEAVERFEDGLEQGCCNDGFLHGKATSRLVIAFIVEFFLSLIHI